MFTFLEDCPEDLRDDMIYLEACEISMERAVLAADVAGKLDALNNRALEIRTAACSNDFDAMVAMYEEAGNTESSEKKAGIIRRAWEAIKKFFREMKAKLFKSNAEDQIDDNAEGTVDEETRGVAKKLAEFVANAKQAISNHKGAAIATAIVSAIGVLGALGYMKSDTHKERKQVKLKGKEVKKLIKDLKKSGESIDGLVDGMMKANIADASTAADIKDVNAAKQVLKNWQKGELTEIGLFGSLWGELTGHVKNIGSAIKNTIGKLISKFSGKSGEADTSDNTTPSPSSTSSSTSGSTKGGKDWNSMSEMEKLEWQQKNKDRYNESWEESWDDIDTLLNLASGNI